MTMSPRDRSPEPTTRDLSTPPPQTPIYRAAADARRQEKSRMIHPVPISWLGLPDQTTADPPLSRR